MRKASAAALAAMLALAGCNKPADKAGETAAAPPTPVKILTPTTTAMPPCNGTPNAAQVVRVVIPPNFDANGVGRNVKHKPMTADFHDDRINDNGQPNAPAQTEPFHVEVQDMTPGDWVMVRVVLRDNQYTFYDDGKIRGVGVGDDTNALNFCGADFDTQATPWPVAYFFVQVRPDSGHAPVEGPFNIGLKPKHHPGTPIFIDPTVKNNG